MEPGGKMLPCDDNPSRVIGALAWIDKLFPDLHDNARHKASMRCSGYDPMSGY
jgi:hypothetical protein